MAAEASLAEYYARRAREYERIYEKPERQADLRTLKDHVRQSLAGHAVLEVACGTGYWTQAAAETARSIRAVDINEGVLAIARSKEYSTPVTFEQHDAFNLRPATDCSAGLAVFWWSHLTNAQLPAFLKQFHQALAPGALVVFIDNRFVEGSSTPIHRTDNEGNTYQERRLETGQMFEVLKNFPTEPQVRTLLSGLARDIRWTELPYYWLLTYRTNA